MIISKYYEKDGKMYVEASDYDKILYELKNSNEEISKLESELESKVSEIENIKRQIEKLASIRTRCHESARDSFDLGNYGCLHIVTADELKTTKDENYEIKAVRKELRESKDYITKLKHELEEKCNFETDRLVKLPFDALETANMLINATYKDEIPFWEKQVDRNVYDIDDLEQIAEHLLVYCKHNMEDEKQWK